MGLKNLSRPSRGSETRIKFILFTQVLPFYCHFCPFFLVFSNCWKHGVLRKHQKPIGWNSVCHVTLLLGWEEKLERPENRIFSPSFSSTSLQRSLYADSVCVLQWQLGWWRCVFLIPFTLLTNKQMGNEIKCANVIRGGWCVNLHSD